MGNFIWVDGFDHYSTRANMAKAYSVVGSDTEIGAYGRLGSDGIRASVDGITARYFNQSFASRSTIVTGIAVSYYGGLPSVTRPLFQFRENSLRQVTIAILSDGRLRVIRGDLSSGTTLGNTTNPVFTGTEWHYIEVKIVFNDSTGSVLIHDNGVQVLSLTSQDTNATGGSSITTNVSVGYCHAATTGAQAYYDDFYIHQDTMQGDIHMKTLFPNANGTNSSFTGSDGNSTDNYALVDEAAPSESDYVGSSTVGHKDTYGLQDLSVSSADIKCVAAVGLIGNSDAGARTGRQIILRGGSYGNGASRSPSTTSAYYQDIFETDPNTAAAFTVSNVNDLEAGVEVLT